LGSFRWLINLWFILLTPTFSSVRTYFLYNHTSSSHFAIRDGTTGKSCEGWMGPIQMGTHIASAFYHILLCVVVPHGSHAGDGWTYAKGNPPSRLCLATFCHTWTFRIVYMRGRDPLHSKRSVTEAGCCPCSGLTHGYRFYSER
jgi:hypothetical protein